MVVTTSTMASIPWVALPHQPWCWVLYIFYLHCNMESKHHFHHSKSGEIEDHRVQGLSLR